MLSWGEKPVRQWAEKGLTVPEPGSVSESEAKVVFDEYRLPVFVVKSDIFNQNHPTAPAFSSEGQVFLREDLPEIERGDIGAHEAGHVMKQVGYAPYLKFIEKTPELMNKQSPICIRLMEHAAEHNKVELFNMSKQDAIDLYDEINDMVYGAIHAGRSEILEFVRPAFFDFDTYAAELSEIHEQFKRERRDTQTHKSRKGFSVDRELDQEIRQIVKEAREGGKSEEAVQADIRALVQESYQRMAEQYGTIPTGERPTREVRIPRKTSEDKKVSQTVRTILEAGATPEELVPNLEKLKFAAMNLKKLAGWLWMEKSAPFALIFLCLIYTKNPAYASGISRVFRQPLYYITSSDFFGRKSRAPSGQIRIFPLFGKLSACRASKNR